MAFEEISDVVSSVDIELAAGILARAFHTDPPFEYFIPDPVKRSQVLPQFFTRFVRHGQLFGEVYTPPSPEAAAIWFSPGNVDMTSDRERRSGLDELPEVFGEESFSRLAPFLAHMEDMHHTTMTIDHWYLAFIGVEPRVPRARRRRRHAEADAVPCRSRWHALLPRDVSCTQRTALPSPWLQGRDGRQHARVRVAILDNAA